MPACHKFLYDLGLCNEEDESMPDVLNRDPALKDKHDSFANPAPEELPVRPCKRQATAASTSAKVESAHRVSTNHSILEECGIYLDDMAIVYLLPDP